MHYRVFTVFRARLGHGFANENHEVGNSRRLQSRSWLARPMRDGKVLAAAAGGGLVGVRLPLSFFLESDPTDVLEGGNSTVLLMVRRQVLRSAAGEEHWRWSM